MKTMEFTSLEFRPSLAKTFSLFRRGRKFRNIHWISREVLDRLGCSTAEEWKWSMDSNNHAHSLKPVSLDRLYQLWRTLTDHRKNANAKTARFQFEGRAMLGLAVVAPGESEVIGWFLFESAETSKPFGAHVEQCLKRRLAVVRRHLFFCWQYHQAKGLSYIDDLTMLYNQRYLLTALNREIQRTKRQKSTFSVLFLDIDFFKRVNDTRGHWAGSKLLSDIAIILKDNTRTCDYLFRYGGDEFLMVLVDSDAKSGHIVAERIRRAIEGHSFQVGSQEMHLTVSIGLAAFPEHAKSAEELIQLADQAMYYGKHKSRNSVYVAS